MTIPLSVFMLRRKRNEIRDAIANYEAKLKEARADLAHVLATLRLYEVSGEAIRLWFPPTDDYAAIEARLREVIKPMWNRI